MDAETRVKKDRITVTLSCGHQVTAKNPPMGGHSKYSCVAGTGCGYSLVWTRYYSHASGVECVNDGPTRKG